MNVFSKAPNGVVAVCATVVVVALIASVTLLIVLNRDTHTFLSVIQTILTAAGLIVGSGGLLYAGAAAKQADTAASAMTNGVLHDKVESAVTSAVQAAINAHEARVHTTPPVTTQGS